MIVRLERGQGKRLPEVANQQQGPAYELQLQLEQYNPHLCGEKASVTVKAPGLLHLHPHHTAIEKIIF